MSYWPYADQVTWVEVESYTWKPRSETTCRVFWGSHGCSLLRGHDGIHICDTEEGADSEHDGVNGRLRTYDDDDAPDGWTDWKPWTPFGEDA